MASHEFIQEISEAFETMGYQTDRHLTLSGIQALLYARSPHPQRLGFAQVEDHFLFVDWDNDVFAQVERLQKVHQVFSGHVNKGFRVPHSLRMRIPNLAVVAISQVAFPADAIRFATRTYLIPWYGGETGQIVLVSLENQVVICHPAPEGRQQGSLPLGHAVDVIETACRQVFASLG